MEELEKRNPLTSLSKDFLFTEVYDYQGVVNVIVPDESEERIESTFFTYSI